MVVRCWKIEESNIPDRIILEVIMPKLDGYQTIKVNKENEKLIDAQVAFLSAKNKASYIQQGLNLGADKYIFNPLSLKKLVSEVSKLSG